MTRRAHSRPLSLATRELLDIHDGQGLSVTCLEGVVWITQSNDPRDVVVHAGESFVLDRPGLALVCAIIGPASIVVEGSRSLYPARPRDQDQMPAAA